jgi:class 3 adenylate cyclase/tetratricopeptide (TPR) repeat protein
MRCPRCQHENPPQAKFCLECGAQFAAACVQCGTQLPAGAKFCLECGKPTGTAGTEPARFASPQSYPPKHLAEKTLSSKAALEGERKQVTVLFADLKGSMELLADRDPEEARKILDPVLERMIEAVHRYEGTVNQVMGDGIMALFGAPQAHEDHAVRACYAALRMQESVKRYAEELRRAEGVLVQIRVGLNSGEVVVRSIASDLHVDYTAVGQTTHLAARMEQLAPPGTVRLTGETARLAEGYVEVRSLGPIPVKGLSDTIEIFELIGAGEARTRLQAAALRGLTRFVGRDAEVEHLRRVLGQAGAGHGQVVAIVGEAGVGKSRLTYEFTHSHRLQGWLALESASVSYGKASSYLPVIDLLKGYFKIRDRDDLREIREKVAGKLLTLDRALEPTLPVFLSLLDVPVDDAAWQSLDPGQRRQLTLDGVKRLLLREAREQPLLVIFEDLHWIDGETQALLDGLVESLGSARLVLLVNYRPEYQHAWGSKTSYSQLRLDALPVESAGELLDALLGDEPGLAPLKQLLVRRANPFFLEETVRTLVETKALEGERGRYRLTQPVHAIQIPPTVQVMLAARIDRLAPEDKRLLQVASVIGKDVPFALLKAIGELPDETLGRGLAHLQAAEFLDEIGLYPDLEYAFKHALTHEVTYGGLLQERRRDLHARTAKAIERLYASVLTEHVERLVDHAVRGEVWDKAAAYGVRAGTRALDRSAHARISKAFFDTALDALGHLPESRETLEQGLEVRFLLGSSLFALGMDEAYLSCSAEAVTIAERLGAEEQLARGLALQTNAFWFTGDNTRALESAQRAVSIAEKIGHRVQLIHAYTNLGLVCRTVGAYRRALAAFDKVVELLPVDEGPQRLGRVLYPVVLARSELAWSYAELGQFDRAAKIQEEALSLAERIGHTTTLLVTRLDACQTLVRRAAFREAIPRLETVNQALRDAGLLWRIRGSAVLGYALVMTGRVPEGIALLSDAVEETARGRRTDEARWMTYLSEAYLRAGRLAEARNLADQAIGLSRQRAERATEAHLLHLLGAIGAQSDGTVAERQYFAAMALAEELGMRPLVAHCHLGLGKLYRRTGKREQAQEHLTTATTMYREMDMRFWLEQAEVELGELK